MRLDRQYAEIRSKILDQIDSILSVGQVLQSHHIAEIEQKVAKLHGVKYGVAVNSGTDALKISFKASGIGYGAKILTTPLSFVASTGAILEVGASPIFLDVGNDMHVQQETYLAALDQFKPDGILLVHLFGGVYDYSELIEEAEKRGIPVFEDCAQAFGAIGKTRKIGENVRSACLSFDPMKVLSAYGSGGMILTNCELTYERSRSLRYHGRGSSGEYETPGYNSQLASIQAAILLEKLEHFDKWTHKRQKIAERYNEAIEHNQNIEIIEQVGKYHVFHKYVVSTDIGNRDKFRNKLNEIGIQTMIHYQHPLSKLKFLRNQVWNNNFVNTENISKQVFSLPIYAELSDEEVKFICDALKGLN